MRSCSGPCSSSSPSRLHSASCYRPRSSTGTSYLRGYRVESVGELKRTLIEVILVYLVVDFATDLAAGEGHVTWETLVVPISILLIAGALRVVSGDQPKAGSG